MSVSVVPPYREKIITVSEALDFQLEHNSTRPAYVFAAYDAQNQQVSEADLTEITYLEFVRASHRAAHLIRPGRSGRDGKVVAVVALVDTLVYQTVVSGLFLAGFKPLLISPRLTPAAVIHLLRQAGCHRVLATRNTLEELLRGFKVELVRFSIPEDPVYDVVVDEIPNLNQLFPKLGTEKEADPFKKYPSTTSLPKADDVAVYLHSSGSTGLPKAIAITHRSIIHGWARMSLTEHFHSFRMGVMPLPPFHALGFSTQFVYPIFASISTALYPPTVTKPDALPISPSPTKILQHFKITKSDFMIIVPSLLQIWAQDEGDVEILKGLKGVMFGGGPLSPPIGEYLVSRGVHLRAIYGSTEVGAVCDVSFDPKDDEDWCWMTWAKETNIRWVSQGDGKSELQFLNSDTHVVSVRNLDDVPGYATSDLWVPHPSKPGKWKIVGRIDEVLIHSSGEKTVPMPIENVVMTSPLVQGVVMFGRQRDQAGILIEPSPGNKINVEDDSEVSRFRNQIWPVIDEANRLAPSYSRIYKEMILITPSNKPLPRAPKGTILRKAAYQVYEKEIDQIYESVESNAGSGLVAPPASWEQPDVQSWLTGQAKDICGKPLAPFDDMFHHGFDSLRATVLRLRIVSALSGNPSTKFAAQLITQNVVYEYPSIHDLSVSIVALVQGPSSQDCLSQTHEEVMEAMIQSYSQGLHPLPNVDDSVPAPSQHTVLLTGSTGNLGSQMLVMLLSNEKVERVYALNRPSTQNSIVDRHRGRFEDKLIDINFLASTKLVFLEGECSQLKLGLTDDIYDQLKESLTLVIHNAWRLDFNLSLSSFEPHVRGTRNLIELSRSCRHVSSVRFLFTSSIGATQSWDASLGPYPEEVVMNPKYAVGAGYGESKYVSERLLHKSGLHFSSFRIGQIVGGQPSGAWAISDWLPMIVKSGLALNMLPYAHGVISWVPTDAIAEAILDVGFSEQHVPPAVNPVHPRPVSWTSVMEAIRQSLLSAKNLSSTALPLVPFQKWFTALEESAMREPAEEVASKMPAAKILEFVRSMAEADTHASKNGDGSYEALGLSSMSISNIQRISPRMKDLEQINYEDAERWVKYWVRCGV
ncbi:hypothetical protein GYMLUDRAFT_195812 [Collybiopsis luxurians FD-317 M1]|uniref:L-aminoadipate-semialdehyde dehydrogenase n=1 Tax=Collybiopsis luxurians FD-317 M1 TaxID=944289 RepID=A0A0D0BIV8_9AGAR|nr:hypothetical protein GYMLUDRAFT_195812 [Collybiopsis luxurians FD-317 M1]